MTAPIALAESAAAAESAPPPRQQHKQPAKGFNGDSTETALIAMLDRHGERTVAATAKGMSAIAEELRDLRTAVDGVREDNTRTMNRMLMLVGAVALVAIVMMAGLVRATYLTAGLDGIKAGSGSPYSHNDGPADAVNLDEDTSNHGGGSMATPRPRR
jgi:hypothetical protein